MTLNFTLRAVTFLTLNFTYDGRWDSKVILDTDDTDDIANTDIINIDTDLFQHHLLKISLLPLHCFGTFVEIQ